MIPDGLSGCEESFGRGLVSNQAIEQLSPEGAEDRRRFGRAKGCTNRQCGCGNLQGNAGDALVGAAIHDLACGAERPANDLANGPETHELQQLLTANETVDMELRVRVDLANTNKAQIGPLGDGPDPADSVDPQELFALRLR